MRDLWPYLLAIIILAALLAIVMLFASNIRQELNQLEGEFSQCRDRLRISEAAREHALDRLETLEEDGIRLQGQIDALSQMVQTIKASQKAPYTFSRGVKKVWQKKD